MAKPAPLVSIPKAPVPDHGRAEWLHGADGAALRAALFDPDGPARGSVVVSPGRGEPIEKYFEVVGDLLARGFTVLVHDWRGQGLSRRPLPERLKGHAVGFKAYLDDYQALLDRFATRLPRPWIALGHSMGGCLTLLVLVRGETRFSACVLSAPMLGLNTGRRPAGLARALAWLMAHTGRAEDYVLGDPDDPFAHTYAANALTHDPVRYARFRAQQDADPDLALGGFTWGWIDSAFAACAWLRRAPGVEAITLPVTIVGAGQDSRVLTADQKALAARIPKGRYLEIEGAFHELLIETDPIRAQFWAAFDETVAGVLA